MNEDFIKLLEDRFTKNMHRHPNLKWGDVEKELRKTDKINSLEKMEETGGEIDVIKDAEKLYYYDFSKETPLKRRSLCYDKEAREKRKLNSPESSVEEMIKEMGIELLSEEDYRKIQEIEDLDTKTSSWIKTDEDVFELGGALFADRRYNKVFVYHNGRDSYYSSRGFRGKIEI